MLAPAAQGPDRAPSRMIDEPHPTAQATQPSRAEEKPRTPPPVTFGVRARRVHWGSLQPLVAVGLLVGVASTSILAVGSWLVARSRSVATTNLLSPVIISQPSANPPRPTEAETPTAVAAAAPAVTVEPNAPPRTSNSAPTAASRRPSSPKVPALSASQQAHQSEVQRMRERLRDLDLDLKKDAKGAPW